MNTYKEEGGNVCLPCPLHSHTNAVAQQKGGCICDSGFTGDAGGPCEDVDECAANSGRGDCEDTCKNLDGGYECSCTTVPGQIVHPDNPKACKRMISINMGNKCLLNL